MKGIMLKDLYENFYIKKNLAAYIFGVLFIGLAMIFIDSNFTFVLYTMLLSIAFGSCMLEAPYEQDEKANFYKLQFTFPLTKAEIVLSKYLLALISTGISLLIALVYALANVYLRPMVALREALTVWGLSICVSLVFISIVYIFYFLSGKKIGTFIYIAAALILGGLYGGSTVFCGHISRYSPACAEDMSGYEISSSFVLPIIRFRISTSVCFIPALPTYPTALIVFSGQSITNPSPLPNVSPFIAILWLRIAACSAVDILAAQLGFAPSHTMPPASAIVLTTVFSICSSVPPCRYVIPAPAPAAAHTAPQYAESDPIYLF